MRQTFNIGNEKGVVSIGTGDGGASNGMINVSGRGAGDAYTAFRAALELARQTGGATIEVLPGDYYFETPFVVDAPVEIRMSPRTFLYPRNTGAIGIARFNSGAAGSILRGGQIMVDRWVDSQDLVYFDGVSDPLVERVGVYMTTQGGYVAAVGDGGHDGTVDSDATHSATPMRFFVFDACPLKTIQGCFIKPGYGSVPIYARYGQHLTVRGNMIGSFDGREIVDVSNHVQQQMKRGIWLHHDGWAKIEGNQIKSTGTSESFLTGPSVEDVIFYQYEEGVADPELTEAGHLTVHDNTIEDVLCRNMIHARGLRWGTISSNRLDNSNGEINLATEGVINLEAEDGGATGRVSHDIAIIGNHSHNPVSGGALGIDKDGVFLLARAVARCSLQANVVKVFRGLYCVRLHPDDCPDFLANANVFESGSLSGAPQTEAAYYIEDGTAPRYVIANEVCSGMNTGVIDKGTVTGGVQNETNNVSI